MIGSIDTFSEIFGSVPEGDITWNARVAKAMVRHGLAVVIIKPNDKLPACTLSARDAKKADEETYTAVQADPRTPHRKSSSGNILHPCGVAHAITQEKELNRVHVKRLFEEGANLAIALGKGNTRLMVIDLDTSDQVQTFNTVWRERNDESNPSVRLTVSSPGVLRDTWIHKDGGHIWMPIPEGVELPDQYGKFSWCPCHEFSPQRPSCSRTFACYWGSGYVLVPPSVRLEGPYRLVGEAVDAPDWITALAWSARPVKDPGAVEGFSGMFDEDPIDQWAALVSWDDLLTADGYTPGGLDTCGCPTFTRPGDATHSKSVTGHGSGCARYDTSKGQGPLHIWSDALGGEQTMSKLSYVAKFRHGGDVSEAMQSLGINRMHSSSDVAFDIWEEDDASPKGENVTSNDSSKDESDSWQTVDLSSVLDESYEAPKPTIFPRTDGECLLYAGKLHSFHGESESAKSLVCMWIAVQLMNDGYDVLWITFDSDPSDDVTRALRMGCTKNTIKERLHYVKPDIAPRAVPESYKKLFYSKYSLAIIDGVTDALTLFSDQTKGDPNHVYTEFSRIFPRRLADMTGAAVVLIDHVAKDTENRGRFAIGAQAKMSQLTGAAYVVEPGDIAPTKGGIGEVVLRIAKDRPGEIRRVSGPRRERDRTQEATRIQVDDTGDRLMMRAMPPRRDPFDSTGARPEDVMLRISRALESQEGGLSGRSIEELVKGKSDRVRLALEIMSNEGYLSVEPRGRARFHVLIRPYTSPQRDTGFDPDALS